MRKQNHPTLARKGPIRKISKNPFFLALPQGEDFITPLQTSFLLSWFKYLLKLPPLPWFQLLGFLLVISLELFLLQFQFLLGKSNIWLESIKDKNKWFAKMENESKSNKSKLICQCTVVVNTMNTAFDFKFWSLMQIFQTKETQACKPREMFN